jgi:uncharacterized protein (TIGR02145 family)
MRQRQILLFLVSVIFLISSKGSAQDAYLGDIKIFSGSFVPSGWAFCDGQLLAVSEHEELFSLLGTTYGGDGTVDFALPDLRSRVAIHSGEVAGLSSIALGEKGGAQELKLSIANLPSHNHALNASSAKGSSNVPTDNFLGDTSIFDREYSSSSNTTMSGTSIGNTGEGTPVSIVPSYLGLNYIICVSGLLPSATTANTQYSDQAGLIASLQAQINAFVTEYGEPLPSVAIGTQKWMKKNLDVATYRDGTPIPEVPRFKEDGSDNGAAWGALKTGAWCYYTNADGSNEDATYGKLYNWYAVAGIYDAASLTDSSLRKQFAPTGWHVPSDGEWTTLTAFLDQEAPTGNAGGKMKETELAHWKTPNGGATNSSGFTGLPGGYRRSNGAFGGISNYGYWWSSTEYFTTDAWYRNLGYNNGNVYRYSIVKTFGFSVRCLRD